jgi:hypothetical protein
MVRRCLPGVFCFENVSFLLFVVIVIGIIIFVHTHYFNGGGNRHHGYSSSGSAIFMPMSMTSQQPATASDFLDFGGGGPSSNQDVLMNPYVPPLRDNTTGSTLPIYDIRGGTGGVGGIGGGGGVGTMHYGGIGMRVNVPTQSVDTSYRQVGILTRNGGGGGNNSSETILPLIGRPLFTNRDKWQFYSLSDKNNAIKLPVTVGGRSGTSEYGCNNVSSGDVLYVEGYNDSFKVSVYDNATLRYLPF